MRDPRKAKLNRIASSLNRHDAALRETAHRPGTQKKIALRVLAHPEGGR
jgi:hypothetical protein